jgi:hypothetical protein
MDIIFIGYIAEYWDTYRQYTTRWGAALLSVKNEGTHWMLEVGLTANLDMMAKRKFSLPLQVIDHTAPSM